MRGMQIYEARKRRNGISVFLYYGAAIFGIVWLVLILAALLREGVGGLSLSVFTQNTPPPGSAGGLLNAIVGSLIMTSIGVVIGAPIGLLAGTYLAEYGRGTLLASVVRFINDILLSAPSIVIGLFIYEILVVPTFTIAFDARGLGPLHALFGDRFSLTLGGHFSGIAGAVALAVIVVPVVVRTTEDMLLLVPGALREAGTALGMPRALVINKVAYRAAQSGLVTGLLLAVARISGETAPLLFTALNNQFFKANLNEPMASLPVVIFQFAQSPYQDWQKLAWAGALLITLTVLALSIGARVLSSRKAV